jgi:hypothetical protein
VVVKDHRVMTMRTARILVAALLGAVSLAPGIAVAAPPVRPLGELTVDGPSGHVRTDVPGAGVSFTFAGGAGQTVSVGLAVPLGGGNVAGYASRLLVRDPQGTAIAWYSAGSGQVRPTFRVPVPTLTATGVYTVELAPIGNALLLVDVAVSSRLAAGSVTIAGSPRTVSFDPLGREQELTFAGVADDYVAVAVTELKARTPEPFATPGFWLEVHRPNSTVAYRGLIWDNGEHPVGPLRLDGPFTIRVWPLDASYGSATVGVTRLAH